MTGDMGGINASNIYFGISIIQIGIQQLAKWNSNICVCFRNFVTGDESCPDQPALAKWSCLVVSVGSFCQYLFSPAELLCWG